jgi:hypothetical protein
MPRPQAKHSMALCFFGAQHVALDHGGDFALPHVASLW